MTSGPTVRPEKRELTAIITGGSGGIGSAAARRLCAQEARVVLVGRRLDALQETARSLPAGQALCVAADVTRPDDVQRMVDETLSWTGRIDVLANVAGAAFTGKVEDFPVEQWRRLLDVNLTAVFLCCRAVVPVMRKQGHGLIVNLASVAARQAFPDWAAYCATKFGLLGFTRALQEEVRASGIRLTTLLPGSVDTPLWETFPNTFDRARMLTVDDVAEAIAYVVTQPPHLVVDELSLIYAGGAQ